MAESPKKTDSSKDEEQAAAPEKAAAPEEVTYHRDRLIREADAFFGVPSHVVVGALAHVKAGTKVNFTRDEIEQAIQGFGEHEVEMAGEEA